MRLFVGIPLTAAVIEEAVCDLDAPSIAGRWPALVRSGILAHHVAVFRQYPAIRMHRQPASRAALAGPSHSARGGWASSIAPAFSLRVLTLPPNSKHCSNASPSATGLCGFIPETRPYHPHITLARSKAKGGRGLRELKGKIHRDPRFSGFIADGFGSLRKRACTRRLSV